MRQRHPSRMEDASHCTLCGFRENYIPHGSTLLSGLSARHPGCRNGNDGSGRRFHLGGWQARLLAGGQVQTPRRRGRMAGRTFRPSGGAKHHRASAGNRAASPGGMTAGLQRFGRKAHRPKYSPINKCVFGCHNRRAAALAPACSARTAAHLPPCIASASRTSGSVCQNSHLFLVEYLVAGAALPGVAVAVVAVGLL